MDKARPGPAATDAHTRSHQPLKTDADMPPLDALNEHSDYSGFLSPGVSEELRRLALRKLFHLPRFNVRDELDDCAEDYTGFTPLGDIVTADMRHRMELEKEKAREHLKELVESKQEEGKRGEELKAVSDVGAQKSPETTPAAQASDPQREEQERREKG